MPIQKRRPPDPFIARMEAKRHSNWVSQLPKPATTLTEPAETTATWLKLAANWWTLVRNFMLNAVGTVFFIGVVALLYDAVMRPTIAIGAISVPEDLQRKGYTSDVTADKLRASINILLKTAHSVKGSEELTKQAEIPDVVVPHTGLSVEAIAGQIRKMWGLGTRWQISGGITVRDDELELDIRAGNDVDSRVTIVRSQAKDFQQLIDSGAAEILRATDPYILAVAYYRTSHGKGEELARWIVEEGTEDAYWAHYFLGIIRTDQGKDGDAIAHYRQAIALQPSDKLSHKILAALTSMLFGLELDAKYAYPHYNLGIMLSKQGKLDEAANEFNTAIRLNPRDPNPHCHLGGLLKDQGRLDSAIAEYKAAAIIDPKNALPHAGIAAVFWKQGDLRSASSEYKLAAELDPKDARTHYNLGILLGQQNRFDDAVAEYMAAAALDPTDSRPRFNLGIVLSKKGKLEEAIGEYRVAAALDAKDARPHLNLGLVFSKQGKLDQATLEYKEAIRLNPKDGDAHYDLGVALYHQGKLDEATSEYKTAVALNPADELPHYNMGVLLSQQGKLEDAIAEYKEAIKLQPKDARPHYNLGLILRDLGRLTEARVELASALKLDPHNSEYQQGLETSFNDGRKEERPFFEGAMH